MKAPVRRAFPESLLNVSGTPHLVGSLRHLDSCERAIWAAGSVF